MQFIHIPQEGLKEMLNLSKIIQELNAEVREKYNRLKKEEEDS